MKKIHLSEAIELKRIRDRYGEMTPLVTRDINTHGTGKDIIDILRTFEGQYVLLEANGVFYNSQRLEVDGIFYSSQSGCRCGAPHVDVFSMKVIAEVEADFTNMKAARTPRRELSAWELNKDFYDNYHGLHEQALKMYKPLR